MNPLMCVGLGDAVVLAAIAVCTAVGEAREEAREEASQIGTTTADSQDAPVMVDLTAVGR